MKPYELNLAYKGSRSYLHGTDIFTEASTCALCAIGDGFLSKLSFKRIAYNQLDFHTSLSSQAGVLPNACGTWSMPSGEVRNFWLIESERPVNSSYVFDEFRIIELSQLSNNSISLIRPCFYSTIEAIVVLKKNLCTTLNPLSCGKWLFAELRLSSPLPETYEAISMTKISSVENKFMRSSISIDDISVGAIMFVGGQV